MNSLANGDDDNKLENTMMTTTTTMTMMMTDAQRVWNVGHSAMAVAAPWFPV